MDIFHFVAHEPPRKLSSLENLPEDGLIWVDLLRSESECWASTIEPLARCEIDAEHVFDSMSTTHPSFFDGTADYDMLIFEGLGPKDDPFPLETRTGVLFLFDRMVVSIHADDSLSFRIVKQKLLNGRMRCPPAPVQLVLMILDTMIDRYLKIREVLDERLTEMQDQLLDPSESADDWRALLEGRRQARRLEALSEGQLDALDAWRRGSRFAWSGPEEVRMRDLSEHVSRVRHHASDVERDVEAAVQLHFASVAHRTNRIMRTLTVISAIFFPLTLITGIYGMNFDHMPELHTQDGYYVVLLMLLLLASVLLLLFKRRGYF